MPLTGLNAYSKTAVVTSNGRDLEANVLTKAAQRLMECQAKWNDAEHRERLDYALRTNQKIWTIIQTAVSSDDSPLPIEVRNNILNLSLFVDKRIIEIMAAPTREKLDVIIRVNVNIAEGLRGSSGESATSTSNRSDKISQPVSHLHVLG